MRKFTSVDVPGPKLTVMSFLLILSGILLTLGCMALQMKHASDWYLYFPLWVLLIQSCVLLIAELSLALVGFLITGAYWALLGEVSGLAVVGGSVALALLAAHFSRHRSLGIYLAYGAFAGAVVTYLWLLPLNPDRRYHDQPSREKTGLRVGRLGTGQGRTAFRSTPADSNRPPFAG